MKSADQKYTNGFIPNVIKTGVGMMWLLPTLAQQHRLCCLKLLQIEIPCLNGSYAKHLGRNLGVKMHRPYANMAAAN